MTKANLITHHFRLRPMIDVHFAVNGVTSAFVLLAVVKIATDLCLVHPFLIWDAIAVLMVGSVLAATVLFLPAV